MTWFLCIWWGGTQAVKSGAPSERGHGEMDVKTGWLEEPKLTRQGQEQLSLRILGRAHGNSGMLPTAPTVGQGAWYEAR